MVTDKYRSYGGHGYLSIETDPMLSGTNLLLIFAYSLMMDT